MHGSTLSLEVFAAKDTSGAILAVMISAPRRCGLKQADTLRVDGMKLLALGKKTILPFILPPLDNASREALLYSARNKRPVPVGEFSPVGLFDAYSLTIEVLR